VVQEHEPDHALPIRAQWSGQVATVTVGGEIDMTTVDRLRDCLTAVVSQHPEQLIIDLAAVAFLDSSAIHVLIQARHTLPADCPLVLRGPQPIVRRAFELTGLDQICIIE
jgi:anti-sigma B factor antagonist